MEQPCTVAWQYVVGVVHPEDLPMAAAHLLAAGLDSPALRDLAGRSRREDTSEVDGLFRRAMEELGAELPDDETAERCHLHHVAGRLTAGSVSPREAAATVWRGIASRTAAECAFAEAMGDEYHLDFLSPEDLRLWENAVRLAAAKLARTPFPL